MQAWWQQECFQGFLFMTQSQATSQKASATQKPSWDLTAQAALVAAQTHTLPRIGYLHQFTHKHLGGYHRAPTLISL